VHDLTGTATVRRTPVAQEILRTGDIVEPGQTIVTEDNSTAVIKFEDGQVLAMSPRSSFVVREYVYNKQQIRSSSAAFELLRGGLRFITGVIGSTNPNAVRIRAGNATIGIRGTDGTVLFNPTTQEVTAAVSSGAISLFTPLGAQTISPGTFTRATPSAPPAPPAPVVQAPPAVQQTVTVLAQQPNIPVNTPVVVEVSARAVVAQVQAQALQQQAVNNPALQPQAQQAQQQAQQAVAEATVAAQNAYQQAIQAGAVPPAPPAPPPAPAAPPATPEKPAAQPEKPAAQPEKPAAQPDKPAAVPDKPAAPPPDVPQPPRGPLQTPASSS
jgi:hypothetical protein